MLLDLAVYLAHNPSVLSALCPHTPMPKGKLWRAYYHLYHSKN